MRIISIWAMIYSMMKPQGITSTSFVTSIAETIVRVPQKFCKPCFLVLIKHFVSWGLGKAKQKKDEIVFQTWFTLPHQPWEEKRIQTKWSISSSRLLLFERMFMYHFYQEWRVHERKSHLCDLIGLMVPCTTPVFNRVIHFEVETAHLYRKCALST